MDALERLRATVEELIAERDESRKQAARFESVAEFAIRQRNELRSLRDKLLNDCIAFQKERDEARKLAWKYREALRSLDAVPESEALPWEKDDV